METKRFRVYSVLADIVILSLAFLFMVWTKPASLTNYLPSHTPFFIVLAILWLIISLINGKMNRGKITNLKALFFRVISSNIIALGLATILMYSFREYDFSRTIVLGTVAMATILELMSGTLFLAVRKAIVQDPELRINGNGNAMPTEMEMVGEIGTSVLPDTDWYKINIELIEAIKLEAGDEMASGIMAIVGNKAGKDHMLLSTGTILNILSLPKNKYHYIINLRNINKIKQLDEFLDAANSKLKTDGHFLCCVETKNIRKQRLLRRYPPVLNYIIYTFDFLFNRIMPKLRITRGIWLFFSGGRNHVISRAEALGRLCRAGFRITQETFIGSKLCIEAVRKTNPAEGTNTNYGVLIALKRIGRNGRLFKVYKMRTMHPYSEFIQDYVYALHDLQQGGKFQNDFRITSWGRFCRKVWLDELPMIINLLKGDMKIVGVRPLSKQYFSLYSEEMQQRRVKYRPGLLPPFYADMPSNLKEIQESEKRYLDAYDRNPFFTDIRYFFKSIFNILFRNARSN